MKRFWSICLVITMLTICCVPENSMGDMAITGDGATLTLAPEATSTAEGTSAPEATPTAEGTSAPEATPTAEVTPTAAPVSLSFTMDKTNVKAGETVTFTVTAPEAEELALYYNGVFLRNYYADEYRTDANTWVVSASFDPGSIWEISFAYRAADDHDWSERCASRSLVAEDAIKLDRPAMTVDGTVSVGQEAAFSWSAVEHAAYYNVILSHGGWSWSVPMDDSTATTVTIPGEKFEEAGEYTLTVYAHAEEQVGYFCCQSIYYLGEQHSCSEGSLTFQVSEPTPEPTEEPGQLDPVYVEIIASVIYANRDFEVFWAQVENAEGFNIDVAVNGMVTWQTSVGSDETSCTVPGSAVTEAGSGFVSVEAWAEGYTSYEETISFNITDVGLIYGDFTYEVADGEVTITGYLGNDTDITIPAQIDGRAVTVIGEEAFQDSAIENVILPDTVERIEDKAFYRVLLQSINFPDGLENIGDYAFVYAEFESISLPTTLKSIGRGAFYCTPLRSLIIPEGVEYIGDQAFQENWQLTSVRLPSTLKEISSGLFLECYDLASVTIAGGPTIIGDQAFLDTALTSVDIPASVASIGDQAFAYCDSLTKATVNNSGASLGEDVFMDSSGGFTLYGYSDSTAEEYADQHSIAFVPIDLLGAAPKLQYDNDMAVVGDTLTFTVIAYEADLLRVSVNGGEAMEFAAAGKETEYSYTFDASGEYTLTFAARVNGDWTDNSETVTVIVITEDMRQLPTPVMEEIPAVRAGESFTVTWAEPGAPYWVDEYILTITRMIAGEKVQVYHGKVYGTEETISADFQPGEYVLSLTATAGEFFTDSETAEAAFVVESSDSDFLYAIHGDKEAAYIRDYIGTAKDIIVPAELGGYPVDEIADYAMEGLDSTTVTFPESLERIGYSAFADCLNLEKAFIPAGVTVDSNAFVNCPKLVIYGYLNSSAHEASMEAGIRFVPLDANVAATVPEIVYAQQAMNVAWNELSVPATLALYMGETQVWMGTSDETSCVIPAEGLPDAGEYRLIITLTLADQSTISDEVVFTVVWEEKTEGHYVYIVKNGGAVIIEYNDVNMGGNLLIPEILGNLTVTGIASGVFPAEQERATLPACVTDIAPDAFAGGENMRIYGCIDSAAHTYATEQGYLFIPTDAIILTADKTEVQTGEDITFTAWGGNMAWSNGEASWIYASSQDGWSCKLNVEDDIGVGTNLFYVPGTYEVVASGANETLLSNAVTVTVSEGPFTVYVDQPMKANNNLTIRWTEVTAAEEYNISIVHDEYGELYNGEWEDIYSTHLGNTGAKLFFPAFCRGEYTITMYAMKDKKVIDTASCDFTILAEDGYPFYYSINSNNEVLISDYFGYDQNVILPEMVEGLPVTGLGNQSFDRRKWIQRVTLPETVETIGFAAFYNSSLTEILLPDNLTTIDARAFEATQLEEIDIPNGVKAIENGTFKDCYHLEDVTLPKKLTSIGDNAFENCSLTSISFPTKLKSIGTYAFAANQLREVVIPDGVETIDEYAFRDNASLTSVELPSTLENIENGAFCVCALEKIDIPKGVISIGTAAFSSNALTEVSLPSTLETIGSSAFAANQLTKMEIPASVTEIGNYAFVQNYHLTEVYIYNKDVSFGEDVFLYDYSVTIYGYTGSTAQAYAEANGHTFIPLDGESEDTDNPEATNPPAGEVSFTVNKREITVGQSVTFTITATGATELKFIADADTDSEYEETLPADGDVTVFTRAFSKQGDRRIQFAALVNGAWTEPSDAIVIKVDAKGQLGKPEVTVSEPVTVREGFTASWTAVEHAEEYVLHLTRDGVETWSTTTTATSCAVPGIAVGKPGTYILLVQPIADGYSQNEGSCAFHVKTVKIDSVTFENIANGDILTAGAPVVKWSAVDDAEHYLVSLRDLTTDDALLEKQDVGDDTAFTLDMLTAGHEYRLWVASVPYGATYDSNPEVCGTAKVEFTWRTVPEFTITGVTGANPGDEVTVSWNAPVWKDSSIQPDYYVVWWYGPGLGNGYSMKTSRSASSCTLPASKVAAGEYTVAVYACMYDSWGEVHGYDEMKFAAAEANITVTAVTLEMKRYPMYEIVVNGTMDEVVGAVRIHLVHKNGLSRMFIAERQEGTDELYLREEFQIPYMSNDTVIERDYSILIYGYKTLQDAEQNSNRLCTVAHGIDSEIKQGFELRRDGRGTNLADRMWYMFEGTQNFEVQGRGVKQSVDVYMDDVWQTRMDPETYPNAGIASSTVDIKLETGIHKLYFVTTTGSYAVSTTVAVIRDTEDAIMYAKKEGIALKAWPTDQSAAAIVVPLNTELKVRGKIGDYAYVQLNGANYFVLADSLVNEKVEEETDEWRFELINGGAGLRVSSVGKLPGVKPYMLVSAQGMYAADLDTVKAYDRTALSIPYAPAKLCFEKQFLFEKDLNLIPGTTYYFAVVPWGTDPTSVITFDFSFTYERNGGILSPANGDSVKLWSGEPLEIRWGLFENCTEYIVTLYKELENSVRQQIYQNDYTATVNDQMKDYMRIELDPLTIQDHFDEEERLSTTTLIIHIEAIK